MRWDLPTPTVTGTSASGGVAAPPPRSGFWPVAVLSPDAIRPDNVAIGSGGAHASGGAHLTFRSRSLNAQGSGGAVAAGDASASFATHNLRAEASGGAVCHGVAAYTAGSGPNHARIAAGLPQISPTIEAVELDWGRIHGRLTTVDSSLSGGVSEISADLPTIGGSLGANVGVTGIVQTRLLPPTAKITVKTTFAARVQARLTTIGGAATARTGVTGRVSCALPAVSARIAAHAGARARIAASSKTIQADLRAWSGSKASISAKLTKMGVQVTTTTEDVLAAVVSVNTLTGAVSTYENFPFNSYCTLDGQYFGGGAEGVARLVSGGTDGTAPIIAGLSTGALKLAGEEQKRIFGAVLALHTEEDLTLTVTADEGVRYPAVTATMNAMDFSGFRQRRIVVPKGVRGATWRFELNNVLGGAFDFGHIGVDVAPSARRI